MYLKNGLLVTLLATFALVAACGGGGETHDEMADMESMAKTFSLGGGTATEVHPGDAGSPHVKVDWGMDGANISITYGRPYLKDRVVGESVEPMADRWWRLGSDEATSLVTDTDLMLGGTHIPAGEYTLFTQQMGDEFHLIVNSETGQWGMSYNPEHDFAHIPMNVTQLDSPEEQLTLSIADGQFGFQWGLSASLSFDLRPRFDECY